jgi:hypothetical protein
MTNDIKTTLIGVSAGVLWLVSSALSRKFGFDIPAELSTGLIFICLFGLGYYSNKKG